MKHARLNDNTFAARLEPGDDIHATVRDFCAAQHINNAAVQGIGSVESPQLAHYSMHTKQFTNLQLEGVYEISSLLGNVALIDGQPTAHLHVTVSDRGMVALAGHLVKGECSATLELIITSYPTSFTKSHNDTIGLNLWDFAD